jgi:hypothetical protein
MRRRASRFRPLRSGLAPDSCPEFCASRTPRKHLDFETETGSGERPAGVRGLAFMLERILKAFRSRSDEPDLSNLDLSEVSVEDLPVLELAGYRSLIEEFPPPTDDEIQRFAVHVSQAKSWYKHLPAWPPGVPFQFFVDPWAGQDRLRIPGGEVAFNERTETTPQFHYTWMTTTDYRAQFGRMAFSCDFGTGLFLPVSVVMEDGTPVDGILDNNPSHAVIYTAPDQSFQLPYEVVEAGSTNVTALVHSMAATVSFWEWVFSNPNYESPPQDTGLAETVARIRERCGRVGAGHHSSESDPEINALLKPERERQQAGMVSAMRRMWDLVYPGA